MKKIFYNNYKYAIINYKTASKYENFILNMKQNF